MITPLPIFFALAAAVLAGPVEFGRAELDRAIAERHLNPRLLRIQTEVAVDPPESYRIAPGLVTGGDLRGLMYGLLEAARQIRATGRLARAQAAPVFAIRGVRVALKDSDAEWIHSREFWTALFQALAWNRFNRFNLVLPGPGEDIEIVRFISQTAADYGVDFTLGLCGGSTAQTAPEMQTALAKLLSACPSIRSVQLRLDPALEASAVEAIHAAGRRVILETAAGASAISSEAASSGIPVRIVTAYPDGARPEPHYPFYWEIPQQTSADARTVRGILTRLAGTGAGGFEIDVPLSGLDGLSVLEPYLPWGRLAYDGGSK